MSGLVLWKAEEEDGCGIEAAAAALEEKEVALDKKRSWLYRLWFGAEVKVGSESSCEEGAVRSLTA